MKIIFSIIALLLALSVNSFAQKTFLLKKASKKFDIKIKIDACEAETCEGGATITLMKKGQSAVFQRIQMSNMFIELGKDQKPTANLIELYGENNSGIVFDDYNFDGIDDLALRNGNNGSYGGPSYDIYLAVTPSGKFVENTALTDLASENLGLFTVDSKAKTIETFSKGGCCYHETTRYRVVNNRPQKVYVFIEEVQADGEKVALTTETLVNGKWRKKTKFVLVKDYYKDN